MDIGEHLTLPLLASKTFSERLGTPKRLPAGGWIVHFQNEPGLVLLDERLRETGRLSLDARTREYSRSRVAMSPSGKHIAVSSRDRVELFDAAGQPRHRIDHSPWLAFTGSDCLFAADDRLWVVRPSAPDMELVVIDPTSGDVVAAAPLDCHVGDFSFRVPPHGSQVWMDVGCGQDGIYVLVAEFVEGKLTIEELNCDDCIAAADECFAADGSAWVAAPLEGDRLTIYAAGSTRVVTEIAAADVFASETSPDEDESDAFGYYAAFVSPTRILAGTRWGRLLLIDAYEARVVATVWPEGYALRESAGDITSAHFGAASTLLTVHHQKTLRLSDMRLLV